jgi:hypothetical protein
MIKATPRFAPARKDDKAMTVMANTTEKARKARQTMSWVVRRSG